jgi:hypothetical protein
LTAYFGLPNCGDFVDIKLKLFRQQDLKNKPICKKVALKNWVGFLKVAKS